MILVIPDYQYAKNELCIKLFNIYIQFIYVFDEYYCSFLDYNNLDKHIYNNSLTPRRPYKSCKAFHCFIPFITKTFNLYGIIKKNSYNFSYLL